MIEFLLKSGACTNLKDTDGRSALHIAAHVGYSEAVSLLLSFDADIEAVDNGGRTPLLTASWNDNLVIVKQLIDAGADINHLDQQGATALSISSQKGSYEIALELLTNGALIYASSKNPIQLATKSAFHNIAKLLENWSITTGQRPTTSAPRTSKSLDSFRFHTQNVERQIIATLAAVSPSPSSSISHSISKDKIKTSHLVSYQYKPNSNQCNTKSTLQPHIENLVTVNMTRPVIMQQQSKAQISRSQSSKSKIDTDTKAKRGETLSLLVKNDTANTNSSIKSNKNGNKKGAATVSQSVQSTPISSPALKPKNSNIATNNKFIQIIRKKFKFLTNSGGNNSGEQSETRRTMHRSVTDSIANNKKILDEEVVDDAAFIMNRASINEYFNQRHSFKDYNVKVQNTSSNNNNKNSARLVVVTNNNSTISNNNTSNQDKLDYNNNNNVNLIKRPVCLPLNYFKKETSI